MRLTPIAFVLLLASPLFAQGAPPQSGAEVTVPANAGAQSVLPDVQRLVQQSVKNMRAQMEAQIAACPVGFSVARRSNPGLEVASNSSATMRQVLDVSFRTNERKIVEADITVHGMVFRPRIIGASASDAEDAPEEFILKGTADEPLQLSSVHLQRLGTASWAELTRLVFSDGTTWTPMGEMRCTARPSMLVLVNASTQSK